MAPRNRVLVLNVSYQPIGTTSMHRAVHLLLESRAEPVSEASHTVRSEHRRVAVPSVIRLCHVSPYSKRYRSVLVSRRRVLARDAHRCAYCAKSADTVDHVIPRSRPGGENIWTNVVAACRTCNNVKADRTPEEAGMRLLFQPREPRGSLLITLHAGGSHPEWDEWLQAS
jgi:5-methylcytosine-specific restriction endonuclease McrA